MRSRCFPAYAVWQNTLTGPQNLRPPPTPPSPLSFFSPPFSLLSPSCPFLFPPQWHPPVCFLLYTLLPPPSSHSCLLSSSSHTHQPHPFHSPCRFIPSAKGTHGHCHLTFDEMHTCIIEAYVSSSLLYFTAERFERLPRVYVAPPPPKKDGKKGKGEVGSEGLRSRQRNQKSIWVYQTLNPKSLRRYSSLK